MAKSETAKPELALTAAAPLSGGRNGSITLLLRLSDAVAAILLAADLVVVCASVLLRFLFNAPVEWSDDVARGLMVGSAFFGAASALARGENVGVSFFRDLAPMRLQALVDAASALLVVLISGYVAYHAIKLGSLTAGQTTGLGLALAALIFIWVEGALPGVIFAQQMARGIDNFVLLAIPFFILVGYLMEANGMSVRLIELLQRAVGRMRGGLNVVMVTSMVLV